MLSTRTWAAQYADVYRAVLLRDIMPFWMRHALDPDDGALNNCLDDEGRILSYDRFLWSQGRALWTFSALYRQVEARQEWLSAATGIYRYLRTHGRDERGHWMFRLDKAGTVLERDISIYVDGFVLYGLTEYHRATGDAEAAAFAREIFAVTQTRLQESGYGIAPYVIPAGMKALGIRMIFSLVFHHLGTALHDSHIAGIGHAYAREVLADFYRPDLDAVLEFINLDGTAADTPPGRVCVPGHAIEAMWFLLEIFEVTGERELLSQCCRIMQRHLELGWDEVYGGLRLAIDVSGCEEVAWQKADCKPWWVQVEALIATAYAAVLTGEEWCREWHDRVHRYAFAQYPVPGGEWRQWLDRQGHPAATAALPVKDPFHLPRGLIYLINLCARGGGGAFSS